MQIADMDEDFHNVRIDPGLAELIPGYLRNRHKELEGLETALRAGNFAEIAKVTERMIGVGTPFGFPYITSTSRIIREAALRNETKSVEDLLADYRRYLHTVKIEIK
jgi:hypothetical protein